MSKQNKVNPGTYTQAGRLSPDDVAREAKKQRELTSPDGQAQPPQRETNRVTKKDKADEEDEPEDSVEE